MREQQQKQRANIRKGNVGCNFPPIYLGKMLIDSSSSSALVHRISINKINVSRQVLLLLYRVHQKSRENGLMSGRHGRDLFFISINSRSCRIESFLGLWNSLLPEDLVKKKIEFSARSCFII